MKSLKFLIPIIILSLGVFATQFDVTINPETTIISQNQTAEYNLSISHDSRITQFFEIYSPDVLWDITTQPTSDRTLRIEPSQTKRTILRVRPLYVQPGYYAVPVNIKLAGTNQLARKTVMVGVTKAGAAIYEAAIRTELIMPAEVDPRNPLAIKLRVINQNKRALPEVAVKLRSELINYDQTTSLDPREEKELNFEIKLDPYTPPQEDILHISVFAQDKNKTVRFDVPTFKYTIQNFGDITTTSAESSTFLTTTKNFSYTNNGNTHTTKLVHIPLTWYQQFFVHASTDATLRIKYEGRELYWKLLINPQETETVSYTIDYQPVLNTLIAIIIIIILYYLLRSPITVRKASMVVGSKEGGISELKIMLRIHNRSNYTLHDLIILDMVPPIAMVQKEFEIGTLRPLKIFEQPGKGSQLKWVMESLESHEERILSYKVRTKYSILGSFRLPPAKIKYRFFKYQRSQMSNVENLFR